MENVYVDRKQDKSIKSVSKWPRDEDHEKITTDSQEYIDYENTKQQAIDDKKVRIDEIAEEQKTAGLKGITIQEAKDKIDQIFDSATTVAEVKAATVKTLKKILSHII